MESNNDFKIPEGYNQAESFDIPDNLKQQITKIVEDYRNLLDSLVSNIDSNMKYVINSVIDNSLHLEQKFGSSAIMSLDMVENKIVVYTKDDSNTDNDITEDKQEM